MTKHISNMNQLQKALQPIMTGMIDELAKRVYETLNYFLNDYYTGWIPDSYRRTEAFLRSAVKVDAYPDKGGGRACVFIDYNSMDDYVSATGYQVAIWANTGLHGGLFVSHKLRGIVVTYGGPMRTCRYGCTFGQICPFQ